VGPALRFRPGQVAARGPPAVTKGEAPPPFATIGIAGIGLIGGSIALGVRDAWPTVTISALDTPDRAAEAERRGLIDQRVSRPDELATADLVVLAVPLGAMEDLIGRLGPCAPRGVVTDVGSAKRKVVGAAARSGLARFVGGHPMAGAERSGVEHARADLFRGRPWLLVSGPDARDGAVVEALAAGLGASPKWVTAEAHDRLVAYLSHLPQLIATALMNTARDALDDEGLTCAGPAFEQMTRLASSPPEVWQGILAHNADFAAEAVARLVGYLPSRADLESGEWIVEAFTRAGGSRPGAPPGTPEEA
jgi:prephenate dehydrogenase